jgi:hypothetical protein
MPRNPDRTAYCNRQAANCATAAKVATVPEFREAYLQMEEAWRQLAPELEDKPPPIKTTIGRKGGRGLTPSKQA